ALQVERYGRLESILDPRHGLLGRCAQIPNGCKRLGGVIAGKRLPKFVEIARSLRIRRGTRTDEGQNKKGRGQSNVKHGESSFPLTIQWYLERETPGRLVTR